jgi:TonB-dependent SusC/RagA subfamily outer membrane receptor
MRLSKFVPILGGASFLAFLACGSPGLPPAGPTPEKEVDIGYGSQPKEKTTGAVTSVSGEEISGSQTVRLDELLRGRAAGLQVIPRSGGGYTFNIRGLSSTGSGQTEPLFVIDGVQVSASNAESALAGLTRDDIRQVDVLKDIASTSVYGTRGVGGVVVITTKR